MILHIIPRDVWAQAQHNGSYHAASLEREGFIHFSKPEQVVGTANRFYTGQRDLLLLVVDPVKVQAEVRYEPPAENPASSERFPHIYGDLNLDAVIRVVDFPPDADGSWSKLPDGADE
ncbi:MAG TPA: DUF952 domain-containing protein [Phototrophicaceae bacterium]|nr:DUF952 domain-containing protein [Phototrophicaceae bacterium]